MLPHYWGLGGVLNHSAQSGEELAIEVLLVQVLVLGFTAALWWIARRDLASRVPPPNVLSPHTDTAELEQLCATLETLVTSLARRLDAVERAAERSPAPALAGRQERPEAERPESERPEPAAEPLPDPRYEPVYTLLAAGVADPAEIARRTGLGRGEVELILSLRDRRAL